MDTMMTITARCPIAVPVFARLRYVEMRLAAISGGVASDRGVPNSRRRSLWLHDTR